MSGVGTLKSYVVANLMLILIGLFAWLILAAYRRGRWGFRARPLLALQYAMSCALAALPALMTFAPRHKLFPPVTKIWTATSLRAANLGHVTSGASVALSVVSSSAKQVHLGGAGALIAMILLGAAFTLYRLARDFRTILRIEAESYVARSFGRVRVLVSDHVGVPFSFWLPTRACVVLPSWILANAEHFKIAVLHELQHHRQRDTVWLHFVQILKVVFFWNPFFHLFDAYVSELQEFACDEALVGRKGISPRAYSRCLFEVANRAWTSMRPVVFMSARGPSRILKRRVELMLNSRSRTGRQGLVNAIGSFVLCSLGAAAWAGQNLVQDQRITPSEAVELAQNAARDTDFPIVMNDRVYQQLNHYLGTPDGRAIIRESFERMSRYQIVLDDELKQFGAPYELLAIPVVESHYQDDPAEMNPYGAAGIWQVLPATARQYGLRVSGAVDERMDVGLETGAALSLLHAWHGEYKDWLLTILAYNAGDVRVNEGIQATHSRDAFALIDAGYEGDKDYVARVMAVAIILRNPSVLDK